MRTDRQKHSSAGKNQGSVNELKERLITSTTLSTILLKVISLAISTMSIDWSSRKQSAATFKRSMFLSTHYLWLDIRMIRSTMSVTLERDVRPSASHHSSMRRENVFLPFILLPTACLQWSLHWRKKHVQYREVGYHEVHFSRNWDSVSMIHHHQAWSCIQWSWSDHEYSSIDFCVLTIDGQTDKDRPWMHSKKNISSAVIQSTQLQKGPKVIGHSVHYVDKPSIIPLTVA